MDSKVCTTCGKLKPLTDFYVRKASKDGRDYKCRDCSIAYAQWRRDNFPERTKEIAAKTREKNRAKKNERQRAIYAEKKKDPEFVKKKREYERSRSNINAKRKRERKKLFDLQKTACEKCGETRPYLLQYHHVDYRTKLYEVAPRAHCSSLQKMESEIKKCVILCLNCHREYHHFYGVRPEHPVESMEEYLGKELPNEQKEIIKNLLKKGEKTYETYQ